MSEHPGGEPALLPSRPCRRRRFFRNTGFSLAQTAITMVLGILLVPFLLWRLGTETYGLWLTLQIFSILGMVQLAELGFQGAVVRYLVRFHAAGDAPAFRRLLATAFLLFAVIGAVCGLALAVFAQTGFLAAFSIPPAHAQEMQLALTVYALGLLVAFPGMILKAFFMGIQDIATLKVWETLDRALFSLAIVALLLLFSERLLAMVLVEQAVMLALFAGFALHARRQMREWFSINPRHARRNSLRGVTRLSGAVFATSVSNQVYVKAPEIVVSASMGPVALAYYQIATRIPRVLKSLQGALNAAVLPYVAGIDDAEGGLADAKRHFALTGLRTSYLLFVPIAAFVVVFAADILRLWVGSQFAFLGVFLALYAGWQLTSVAVGFGTATLTRTTHYRRLVWQNLLVNALFLTALVYFLPRFGLVAVFAALLLSGAATAWIVLVATKTANGFTYRNLWCRVVEGPVLVSGAAGALLFVAAHWVLHRYGWGPGLAATALAGLAYAATICLAILDDTERRRLVAMLAARRRDG